MQREVFVALQLEIAHHFVKGHSLMLVMGLERQLCTASVRF
jgi:hypothetical protein